MYITNFNPLRITRYGIVRVWLNLTWSWPTPVLWVIYCPLWPTQCWSFVFTLQVIPFSRGSAWEQPPPDLASYLYKNRIVYLGMSLVPSVTELILAEFLYLQYEDEEKPIYLYVNSTGTTKVIFTLITFRHWLFPPLPCKLDLIFWTEMP